MNSENRMKCNKPEILAPAGTVEAMKAAVNAGCDAVYMGGDMFSARAYAGNFGTKEMAESIDYCHLFDVRVYMTVNTLLKENETALLASYIKPFYEAGLDGVIVQDMGVAAILKRAFPDLALHASTQMSICSEYGARLMKSLGFTRIVPARELSLEEIRAIRQKVDIEIETFVHGAMCYAYSGKCLFSGFLGGRSGNRGRCAQPCRQRYEILDGLQKAKSEPYILSLKDMCTLSVLPALIDAGIDSFKIEGRMKNPSYVAATTDAYRRVRDQYLESGQKYLESGQEYTDLAEGLTVDMQDIYNRGGFSTGYYFMDKGRKMAADTRPNHVGTRVGEIIGIKGSDVRIRLCKDLNVRDVLEIIDAGVELTSNVTGKTGQTITLKGKEIRKLRPGMKINRTRNNLLLDKVEEDLIKKERKIKAYALVIARTGQPLKIVMADYPLEEESRIRIEVEGNLVEAAQNAPTNSVLLAAKMQKTGGTNLDIQAVCDVDDQAFVVMSDFNDVRRKAMEKFKRALSERYHRQSEISDHICLK